MIQKQSILAHFGLINACSKYIVSFVIMYTVTQLETSGTGAETILRLHQHRHG